jgi:hypothetical protein
LGFLFVQLVNATTFCPIQSFGLSMHSLLRTCRIFALLPLVMAGAFEASAQTALKDSPFLPPSTAAAASKGETAYELSGMSVAGKATLLSITRVRDKRSFWVPVGQTNGEITAISYDPKTDQATIRAEGQLLTLSMRKSAVTAAPVGRPQPMPATPQTRPAALPPVAIPPPPANSQEEKETEARMLVTDLLEIGQEQRRAYEAAQREAAAKKR